MLLLFSLLSKKRGGSELTVGLHLCRLARKLFNETTCLDQGAWNENKRYFILRISRILCSIESQRLLIIL